MTHAWLCVDNIPGYEKVEPFIWFWWLRVTPWNFQQDLLNSPLGTQNSKWVRACARKKAPKLIVSSWIYGWGGVCSKGPVRNFLELSIPQKWVKCWVYLNPTALGHQKDVGQFLRRRSCRWSWTVWLGWSSIMILGIHFWTHWAETWRKSVQLLEYELGNCNEGHDERCNHCFKQSSEEATDALAFAQF